MTGTVTTEGLSVTARLAARGFHVERGRYGWQWTEDADERRADLATLQGWLAEADPPAMLHRPAPWGPVSVSGAPVALKYVVLWKREAGGWRWDVDIWNADS